MKGALHAEPYRRVVLPALPAVHVVKAPRRDLDAVDARHALEILALLDVHALLRAGQGRLQVQEALEQPEGGELVLLVLDLRLPVHCWTALVRLVASDTESVV